MAGKKQKKAQVATAPTDIIQSNPAPDTAQLSDELKAHLISRMDFPETIPLEVLTAWNKKFRVLEKEHYRVTGRKLDWNELVRTGFIPQKSNEISLAGFLSQNSKEISLTELVDSAVLPINATRPPTAEEENIVIQAAGSLNGSDINPFLIRECNVQRPENMDWLDKVACCKYYLKRKHDERSVEVANNPPRHGEQTGTVAVGKPLKTSKSRDAEKAAYEKTFAIKPKWSVVRERKVLMAVTGFSPTQWRKFDKFAKRTGIWGEGRSWQLNLNNLSPEQADAIQKSPAMAEKKQKS